jgi:hypothetical protein
VAIIVGGLYTGYHYSYGTESSPPVAGPGTANIWVDLTGGTCVDNASAVTYTDATACASLAAAVLTAEPGDKIAIRAGAYPFETLARKTTLQNLSPGCDPHGVWGTASSVNCVRVVPDSGDVWIRGMRINASSIWLEGNVTGDDGAGCGSPQQCRSRVYDFHISNTDLIGYPPPGVLIDANCNCKSSNFEIIAATASNAATRPDHVIVDGIDSDTMAVYSAGNVHARNVDVGPLIQDTSIRGSASGSGPAIPRIWSSGQTGGAGTSQNIYYEGMFFHNINRSKWCSINNVCHPDGLYIKNGGPITVKNSGFTQISGEVLFFENFDSIPTGGDTHDVTIENNWFGCKVFGFENAAGLNAENMCGQGPPIDIKNCGPVGCTNFLFRYNSWYGIGGAETAYTNLRFIGNAGGQPSNETMCTAGSWQYNAFFTQTFSCGAALAGTNVSTGSSSPSSLFASTSPATDDYHLAGAVESTVADDLVTPTSSDYDVNTDMDGEARTAGSRDAGADER